jgi:hypothetical protein
MWRLHDLILKNSLIKSCSNDTKIQLKTSVDSTVLLSAITQWTKIAVMLLMLQVYVLIFVPLLGNCANLHQWQSVLPYLNIRYFQETRLSVSETVNNTLCAKDFQMYVDQITESYWAIKSEYLILIFVILMCQQILWFLQRTNCGSFMDSKMLSNVKQV